MPGPDIQNEVFKPFTGRQDYTGDLKQVDADERYIVLDPANGSSLNIILTEHNADVLIGNGNVLWGQK